MPYSYREFEKRLLKLGYMKVRQKGSHVLFSNEKLIFPVSNHGGKDISIGVEKKVLKLLGISADDFKKLS